MQQWAFLETLATLDTDPPSVSWLEVRAGMVVVRFCEDWRADRSLTVDGDRVAAVGRLLRTIPSSSAIRSGLQAVIDALTNAPDFTSSPSVWATVAPGPTRKSGVAHARVARALLHYADVLAAQQHFTLMGEVRALARRVLADRPLHWRRSPIHLGAPAPSPL